MKCVKTMILLSAVMGISATGWAEDGVSAEIEKFKDWSIRVSLGSSPEIDEVDAETDVLAMSGGSGGRFEVLAVKRFLKDKPTGGVLGGGIFIGGHDGTIPGVGDVELSTFGVMLQGGFVAKAGDVAVFEVGPYLGLGIAANDTEGYDGGSGGYGLFGVKGGAFFMLGDSIELGVEAGYEGFSHTQEYEELGGGTFDATFTGSGLHVAGVLSIKF